MTKIERFNKLPFGLLIGLATIFVGYAVVTLIFEAAENFDLIDTPMGEGADKLNRTVWLIAICCNIIGIQVFRKRRSYNIQRGIALATVLAAGVWIFYFKDTLFLSE